MLGLNPNRIVASRLTLLVSAALAALCLAGLNAAGARAEASCGGGDITGEGSSLQRIAQQEVWTQQFGPSACPGLEAPAVSYVSSSSGTALGLWSAFGGETIDHERQFLGTDQPPNATEIQDIDKATAAQNPGHEETNLLVIPVVQTAIAIVANPPKGCTITRIKSVALQRALRGGKKLWSDIAGTKGGHACEQPVTRVVPSDSSGTTYQLKHYLSLVNSEALPCLTAPNDTWEALQASSLNTTWPEACKGHKLSTVKRSLAGGTGPAAGVGGVDEVETVNATPGSIGFAALPDAEAVKSGATTVLEVQNGTTELGAPTYAPAGAAEEQANCSATTYVVPPRARVGEAGFDVDWSQVYGSALTATGYPICTLTWDLAFKRYQRAGFAPGEGTTVADYLYWYQFEGTGEEDLEAAGDWYSAIPFGGPAETNVYAAGRLAASQIQE